MSLPEAANRKITALRLRVADTKALQASGARSIASLREREQYHMSTLARLRSGSTYANTASDIASAESDLTAVQAEIQNLVSMIGDRNRRAQIDSDVLQRIEAWVQRTATRNFQPARMPVDLGDVPVIDALASTRDSIAEAQRRLNATKAASLPVADLKAAARAHVEELARARPPRITSRNGSISIDLMPGVYMGGEEKHFRADLAFLAWLDPERMIERLEAEIDATSSDANTVSGEAKAQAEATLPAEILEWERAEEALVEMAIAAGLDVQRRPEASALAILGIEPV